MGARCCLALGPAALPLVASWLVGWQFRDLVVRLLPLGRGVMTVASSREGRLDWGSLACSRRELLGSGHGPWYGTMLSRLVLRGRVLSPDAGPTSSCSSSSLGRACSCSVGGGILTRPRGAVPAAQVFVKVLGRGLTVLSCKMGCRCMCADANGKDGGRRLALSKWG